MGVARVAGSVIRIEGGLPEYSDNIPGRPADDNASVAAHSSRSAAEASDHIADSSKWWPALPVAYCSQAGYRNENLLRVSVSAARSAVAYSTSAAGGSSGHTGGRLARAACLASPSVIFSICSTVYP